MTAAHDDIDQDDIDQLVDVSPASAEGSQIARSSLALTVSAALTAALGLVYWVVMGRMYPASEVGAAAAVITAATMLSAFGNLGIGAYFERFLPISGNSRARIARAGLLIGSLCGAVLGVVFLAVGPTDEMFENAGQKAMFPFFVVVLSGFALLDHLAIAMHRAQWSAVKNVAHAVAKLLLAMIFALWLGRLGMTVTWVGTAIVGAVILATACLRALGRPVPGGAADRLPPTADQLRFAAANYGVYVVTALAPLLLPMIVIDRVGASQNAYFAIVWSLISAVIVLLTMLMGPYVSAVAADEDRMRELSIRFAQIMALISVGSAVGLVVLGPVFLRLAGSDYATHGRSVLQLAALALPLAAINISFTALCRVRRRLTPALLVQMVSATLMLSLTTMWIDDHGLISAAWALLIAEGTAASIVVVPLIRAWRPSPEPVTVPNP